MKKYFTKLNMVLVMWFTILIFLVTRKFNLENFSEQLAGLNSPLAKVDVNYQILKFNHSAAFHHTETSSANLYNGTVTNDNRKCERVQHFVMIKTEKTGSSTLFSILARFILKNNLNIMVMTKGGHLDVTKQKGEYPGWDIGPRYNERAEALIHHARYNGTLLSKNMHPDAKYITLVRDATSWFSSAIRFWPGAVKFKSPNDVLNETSAELLYARRTILEDDYNGQKSLFHLSQLQWLGFNYSHRNDVTAIRDYVTNITPRFDIGFITDQFDASLIRMKRMFCWDHVDIFYKPKEVGGRVSQRAASSLPLSTQAKQTLLSAEVNLGDQLLYEEFNKTWWEDPDTKDDDFWAEVKQFQENNKIINKDCGLHILQDTSSTLPANQWNGEVLVDASLCKMIVFENYSLLKHLAVYAIGRRYDPYYKVTNKDVQTF